MQNEPRYALHSVDNALRLIRLLQSGEVLYVSSVANRLNIGRSTAHRLLSMVVHHGFAARGPNHEYIRGPALRDPSSVLPAELTVADLRLRVMPPLRTLTSAIQETSNVQLLLTDHTRVIASVECDRPLRVSNREGQNLPADKSSAGLALLGKDLRTISGVSVAINNQAIEDGITAIGVAVPSGMLSGRLAVSVAIPSSRYRSGSLPPLVSHMQTAAETIAALIDTQ